MNNTLENKTALVTGASRGLGKGIAQKLAQYGANVIVNFNKNENEAEKTLKEVLNSGVKAIRIKADVTSEEQVDEMFRQIKDEFGRLDILVNNAGTSQSKDIFDMSKEDWDFILKTNLTSGFLCTKKAMEIMKEQQYGRIIFNSSIVGQRGALFGHVHYAATKSGQIGMIKTLARTGAPHGIRVNAVAPGIIETELLLKIHGRKEVDQLAASIPLGLGTPEDVGEAVAFLASDASRYITGATLDVNGGMNFR